MDTLDWSIVPNFLKNVFWASGVESVSCLVEEKNYIFYKVYTNVNGLKIKIKLFIT